VAPPDLLVPNSLDSDPGESLTRAWLQRDLWQGGVSYERGTHVGVVGVASPTRVLVPRGMSAAGRLTGSIGGGEHRGTSLIRNRPSPKHPPRTLGIGLR